jgi:hypothetical protein
MCQVPAREQQSPELVLPTHPKFSKKYEKYNPGLPNIDNIIENLFVYLKVQNPDTKVHCFRV